MMRTLIVLTLLGGCVSEAQKTPRWPDHRKQHDSKLTELETLVESQARVIADLTGRVTKLEAEVGAEPAVARPSAP